MKLHEYQSKQLFAEYGLPVTEGLVFEEWKGPDPVLQKFPGGPWVVKAQIHAGGRGKGGGVKLAKTPQELDEKARAILGMRLISPQTGPEGRLVRKIFVTPALEFRRELYLGVVLDRALAAPVVLASAEGGVEIEELAKTKPQAIRKVAVDPIRGMEAYQARGLYFDLGLAPEHVGEGAKLFQTLARMFLDLDLSLAEVNPLVVLPDGRLHCLDAKVSFDDNGLARHKKYESLRDITEEDPREREAAKHGLSYISLDGEIGCLVNGAGLAMATADAIAHFGGKPANFLDVGGGATTEAVTEAFKLILSDTRVKAVLVNIFGGIMKCDVIAQGILEAAKQVSLRVPLVVRLEGTRVEEGRAILQKSGLNFRVARSMDEAAKAAVQAARGGGA